VINIIITDYAERFTAAAQLLKCGASVKVTDDGIQLFGFGGSELQRVIDNQIADDNCYFNRVEGQE
jgi:hypothetical protein